MQHFQIPLGIVYTIRMCYHVDTFYLKVTVRPPHVVQAPVNSSHLVKKFKSSRLKVGGSLSSNIRSAFGTYLYLNEKMGSFEQKKLRLTIYCKITASLTSCVSMPQILIFYVTINGSVAGNVYFIIRL